MKIVNCKKIKDLKKSNRGNRTERTETQKRAALKLMLLHNPMKREECRRRLSEVKKGKTPPCPFPKNNEFWKLRKDIQSSSCKTDTLNSNP